MSLLTSTQNPEIGSAELPPAEEAFTWAAEAMSDGDWAVAAQRWTVLRGVYPEKAAAWVKGAQSYKMCGELALASNLLDEARARFPDNPRAWVMGAKVAVENNNPDLAERLMDEAMKRFPNKAMVWGGYARVSALCGKYEKAEKCIAEALERFPDSPAGYVQRAELAMERGDWQKALELWAGVRERFPKLGAGYLRASAAAEAMGDAILSRQLKLAREYGNAWLEDILEGEEEEQHTISPPHRRDWRMFLDLVWTKAHLNLKSEASKNHLHYLWWVIDPLLYMAVFYIVFGFLMQRGGEGYVGYLLTGLVPFQWFAKTIQNSSNSIVAGKGLMHKVRVTPLFFPLVAITQNAGKQIPVFLMLALFLIVYGLPPTIHWLAIIPIIATQLLFMVFLGCLVAMVVPFVRDVSNLVPTGIQFMLFASGIFYTLDRIPQEWQGLFLANPMANLLYQYRTVLTDNQWPDWSLLGWLALACAIGLGLVLCLYRRFESSFPRVVIE